MPLQVLGLVTICTFTASIHAAAIAPMISASQSVETPSIVASNNAHFGPALVARGGGGSKYGSDKLDTRPWTEGGPWKSWLSCPLGSSFHGTWCVSADDHPVDADFASRKSRSQQSAAQVDDSRKFVTLCVRAQPDYYISPVEPEDACPRGYHCAPHGGVVWRRNSWTPETNRQPPRVVCVPNRGTKLRELLPWRRRPGRDDDRPKWRDHNWLSGFSILGPAPMQSSGSRRLIQMSLQLAVETELGRMRDMSDGGESLTFSAMVLDVRSRLVTDAVESISAMIDSEVICQTSEVDDVGPPGRTEYGRHVCMPFGDAAIADAESHEISVSIVLDRELEAGSYLSWSLLGGSSALAP